MLHKIFNLILAYIFIMLLNVCLHDVSSKNSKLVHNSTWKRAKIPVATLQQKEQYHVKLRSEI